MTESQPLAPMPPAAPIAAVAPPSRVKAAWGLAAIGFGGGSSGAVIAGILTAIAIQDSREVFAELLYLFTVPVGYLVGTVVAVIIAAAIGKRESQLGSASRMGLALSGALAPIALLLLVVIPVSGLL